MKRIVSAVLALFLLFSLTPAAPAEKQDRPNPPVLSALSEDGLSYDDGTISVRVVPDVRFDTKVYFVYVKLTDPSQLRTAMAGTPRNEKTESPYVIAKKENAVLAISGDSYKSVGGGLVYRQGELIRNSLHYTRDELFIDENGDLTILAADSNSKLSRMVEDFPHQIVQAFCFGPGLIIDGEEAVFNYVEKTSCGYPTKAQRMIFCQTGPLEYLFFATEGKEQDQPGLTIPEAVSVLLEHGGVQQAYNLDGGSTTCILLCGNKINAPDVRSRNVYDLICFSTLSEAE